MRWILLTLLMFFTSSAFAQEAWTVFLDQKRMIGPWLEWNREIVAQSPSTFRCRIESQAPIGVTLIAERTYRALLQGDMESAHREDVLLTVDSQSPTFEREFSVPRSGSYWFILENQSMMEVEMHLQCVAPNVQSLE